jgi:hypothetical protein
MDTNILNNLHIFLKGKKESYIYIYIYIFKKRKVLNMCFLLRGHKFKSRGGRVCILP